MNYTDCDDCPPDCHLLTCEYYVPERQASVDDGALARARAYAAAYDLVPRDPSSAIAKRLFG